MASYLQIENISKSYGTKVLFDKISFNINEGDKIALIAPNGTGKSTLLSILAGKDNSDTGGKITFLKDISIGFLEQNYDFVPENTIFQEVISSIKGLDEAMSEYAAALEAEDKLRTERAFARMENLDAWSAEQRVKEALSSLGINDFEKKMKLLSGGELKRVAIAALMMSKPDFIIMDEPTNHLDIEVIEFLEEYLQKSRCTLFMVTHDRYFLDRVCNTIYELDGGVLYSYKGNYSYFLEKREERISNSNAEVSKAKSLLKRELEWIRRTPSARTGKAKYRVDAFEDIKDRAEGRAVEKQMKINVQTSRLGKKLINCKHLTHNFGERCMLEDFTYNFSRFEKVGIVGPNGVGKSTFLNILTGKLQADAGEIERGETIKFGYYHQSGISFKPGQTVFDAVHEIAETVTLADGTKASVSSFLNYFLFPPHTHYTKIERLSGGERRRLYLLTVLMQNPNFLILDEPTNDLDILTLNVLEDYLINFQGSVLIVSHDRYFLDKIADHLFIFYGNGKVKDFVGRCSEYRQYMVALQSQDSAPKQAKNDIAAQPPKKQKSVTVKKRSFKEERELKEVEAQIEALGLEKQQLEQTLSAAEVNINELTALSTRLGEVIDLLDEKEMRWLELNE